MLHYLATLPLWVQLIIIFSVLILIVAGIGAMVYRNVRYGVKVKVGPVEIDSTDDTEGKA